MKNLAYVQLVFASHAQTQSHGLVQLLNISSISSGERARGRLPACTTGGRLTLWLLVQTSAYLISCLLLNYFNFRSPAACAARVHFHMCSPEQPWAARAPLLLPRVLRCSKMPNMGIPSQNNRGTTQASGWDVSCIAFRGI